ncbi:LysR substrate-binding domain-containing protein [Pseudomonas sp. Pseu.R1]|uniref:LysR substrate-binding domain-containing protein n=1 Tax=Pseudomonas sp. Pseu.R1 TaxID=3379818 RepID=UPI003B965C7A
MNVDPYFSRVILAPALGSFMETYPEIELDLVTREQLGDLVAEGVDLAVRFGEQRGAGRRSGVGTRRRGCTARRTPHRTFCRLAR